MNSTIELSQPQLRIQVGKDGEFKCSSTEEGGIIEWVSANKTEIDNDLITSVNGTLKFVNASLDISADYICRGVNFEGSETGTLKVYFMPSYFKEGMIIVAVNGGLFLLFLICTVYSQVKEIKDKKRNEREYKAANVDT